MQIRELMKLMTPEEQEVALEYLQQKTAQNEVGIRASLPVVVRAFYGSTGFVLYPTSDLNYVVCLPLEWIPEPIRDAAGQNLRLGSTTQTARRTPENANEFFIFHDTGQSDTEIMTTAGRAPLRPGKWVTSKLLLTSRGLEFPLRG